MGRLRLAAVGGAVRGDWRVIPRLYVYLAIALAVAGALGYVAYLKHRADKVPGLERTLATERAATAALVAAHEHERKISKDATNDYEARLAALSAAATATPTRSVRLCRSPTGWVPASASTPSGTGPSDTAGHAPEAGRGGEAGPDIGVELYALADEADRHAAQCNSLIKWVGSR